MSHQNTPMKPGWGVQVALGQVGLLIRWAVQQPQASIQCSPLAVKRSRRADGDREGLSV